MDRTHGVFSSLQPATREEQSGFFCDARYPEVIVEDDRIRRRAHSVGAVVLSLAEASNHERQALRAAPTGSASTRRISSFLSTAASLRNAFSEVDRVGAPEHFAVDDEARHAEHAARRGLFGVLSQGRP